MTKIKAIKEKLKDERCKRVIFMSHCLLNMNARYFGGAFRTSCVSEIMEEVMKKDISVIQMKCPEQHAWGGIEKPLMWLAFDIKKTPLYQVRSIILPLFLSYTHLCYRRYARTLVKEISDYQRAGYQVLGIIGIDGSPTCGVNRNIDIRSAFSLYARTGICGLNREDFNHSLYTECLREGRGIFMGKVKEELDRRGMNIQFFSHSLMDEMDGITNPIWDGIK